MQETISSKIVFFLISISCFAFSSNAHALTCSQLDGSWVQAQDGQYLGFFGSSIATDSIMNSIGLYGSSIGVNEFVIHKEKANIID